jgi:hypothetical protein
MHVDVAAVFGKLTGWKKLDLADSDFFTEFWMNNADFCLNCTDFCMNNADFWKIGRISVNFGKFIRFFKPCVAADARWVLMCHVLIEWWCAIPACIENYVKWLLVGHLYIVREDTVATINGSTRKWYNNFASNKLLDGWFNNVHFCNKFDFYTSMHQLKDSY